MLMKAGAKARGKNGSGQLILCRADGLAMPFADGSFDAVINSFGLRNETDFARAIQEMARVLKPGGEMRILEFSLPGNRFLRRAHLLYLARIMPCLSSLCGAPPQAYAYLSRTIRGFITRQQVLDLMKKSGVAEPSYRDVCGGIVCCYRGIKAAHE
jgi:demethylmenaquinone methyltransferase / 2-methoxy-6-polyprenyl-1,4-benzoquinol methylase